MQGAYITFYMPEKHRLHGLPAYEWLLEKAKANGIPGGSAFRAIAGYGRHGVLHEEHFFELAGDLPVEVVFALSNADADHLLEALRQEEVSLVCMRMPVEFSVLKGRAP